MLASSCGEVEGEPVDRAEHDRRAAEALNALLGQEPVSSVHAGLVYKEGPGLAQARLTAANGAGATDDAPPPAALFEDERLNRNFTDLMAHLIVGIRDEWKDETSTLRKR